MRTDITELVATHHALDLTRKQLEEEKENLKSKNAALNELFNHRKKLNITERKTNPESLSDESS